MTAAVKGSRSTPIQGQHISSNTTWNTTGSPYFIKGNLFIDGNATLNIAPGVEVIFEGYFSIFVDGVLNASGSEGAYITFTSKAQFKPGDWDRIQINSTGKLYFNFVIINLGTYGIYIKGASNNSIENTKISSNKRWGIWIENSKNNTISYSSFYTNDWSGMFIEESSNCTVMHCTFYNNDYDGFTCDYSSNIVLMNCSLYNNIYSGIHFYKGTNCEIDHCTSTKNRESGVILGSSLGFKVSQLSSDNNKDLGLNIHYSNNINVSNSNFFINENGIQLINSSYIELYNTNSYLNKNQGIYLEESSNNKLIGCEIYENANTGIYSKEGGYLKSGSSNNEYNNCQIHHHNNGIYLLNSPKPKIIELELYNNTNGLILFKTSNSTILSSKIYDNQNGLRVWRSADGLITGCDFENNQMGLFLGTDSIRNTVHHNLFKNNTLSAGASNPGNFWDDTVSEGNYWSDYNGTDYDENGIGDTPHLVTNFSQDNYPLVDIKNTVLKVMSTEPVNDQILVSMNTAVNITFSERMNKNSIPGRITFSPQAEVLNYTWSNKDRTVSIGLPTLKNGTTYNITVHNTGISSALGKPFKFPYKFRFTTIDPYNYRRPYIVDYSPKGVNVSITSSIRIFFNEPVYHPTIEAAVDIKPKIEAEISLINDTIIFINPFENLSYKTNYTISVNTQIVNLINNSMKFPFKFSFITEPDRIPPYIVDHYPTGKTRVPVDLDKITIIFNEPVDKLSVKDRLKIIPEITGAIVWSNENRSLNFQIKQNLIFNTTYSVLLSSGYMDVFGNPTTKPFVFEFITILGNTSDDDNNTNITDNKPPFVVDYFPTSKFLIPIDIETLIITFNEPVNTESVIERFKLSPPTKGSLQWKNNNQTLYFRFSEKLLYSTNYTTQLLPGYTDLVGNINLEQFQFTFRTIPGFSEFKIIDFSPNGDNVSVKSEIIIVFNKIPEPKSILGAFKIEPTIDGSNIWNDTAYIFRPSSNLQYNTTYRITIDKTAKDINYIFINSSFSWQFTTQRTPIIEPNGSGPNDGNGTKKYENNSTKLDTQLFYIVISFAVITVIIIIIIIILFFKMRQNNSQDEVKDELKNEKIPEQNMNNEHKKNRDMKVHKENGE